MRRVGHYKHDILIRKKCLKAEEKATQSTQEKKPIRNGKITKLAYVNRVVSNMLREKHERTREVQSGGMWDETAVPQGKWGVQRQRMPSGRLRFH